LVLAVKIPELWRLTQHRP